MTHLEIRHLTAEDIDTSVAEVAMTIATAFAPLEVLGWLVPDPKQRVDVLAAQFTIFVEEALKQGKVLVGSHGPAGATAIHAAAVWFHELTGPHTLPDDYDERLVQACGPYIDRFRRLDDAFAEHHPDSYPHYCLTHLATLPDHQGHGLGSALLSYTHNQLDIAEVPSYLVASNTRTRDLYAQHGYQLRGAPLRLPEDLLMWPMLREPQPLTDKASPDEQTAASPWPSPSTPLRPSAAQA